MNPNNKPAAPGKSVLPVLALGACVVAALAALLVIRGGKSAAPVPGAKETPPADKKDEKPPA